MLISIIILTISQVWGASTTYTWTFESGDQWKFSSNNATPGNNTGTATLNSVNWSYDRGTAKYLGSGNSSIQFGSRNNVETPTFTCSAFASYTITNVSVKTSSYNGGHKVAISVGGDVVKSATATPSPTSTPTAISTGTISKTGNIVITFSNGYRALYLQEISVTYETGGGGTTYTVSYDKNDSGASGTMTDSNSPYSSGATVTVLDNAFTAPSGYEFDHWNTSADDSGTDYDPDDTFTISANATLYAQRVSSGGGGSGDCDVLNASFTGEPSSYTSWSNKSGSSSSAVYAGQSTGGTSYIQLRATSPSGIITTTSGGNASSVSVTWNSSTSSGRTLNVYGKNTAYSAASDLYGDDAGTLLGTIVYGTSTSLNITGDYTYIGLRSSSGAMYLDEIDICWETCDSLGTINGSINSISGTSVTLNWTGLDHVSSWTVTCKKGSTSAGTIGSISGTSTKACTITGLTAGETYTFTISATAASGYCDASQQITATTPKITVSPVTITGLNYAEGNGPSTAQTFTVTGVGLTGNLTITAPTNFEVSKTSATSGFASSVSLTPSSGTISATTIWVRLASGKAQGTYGPSNVTVSGGSATALNVSVKGVVSSACDNPIINTHPANATYNMNATPAALSVAATKTGSGPALTYQWYSNTSASNSGGTAIGSATSASYSLPASVTSTTGAKYYYCVVSSGACTTATKVATISVNTPTITVSNPSIAFGDKAVDATTGYTETFTVTGTNLAKDQGLTLAVSGTNQAMFTLSNTTVAMTSQGAVSTTTITVTYKPSTAASHNATITVSSTGATSKTVTLGGTGKWSVTWMEGGTAYTTGSPTTLVANNSKVSAVPTAPGDASLGSCANKFMGWSATDIGQTPVNSAPADLFTTAANSPAITANTTFYAVYATASGSGGASVGTVMFSENFGAYAANAVPSGSVSSSTGNRVIYGDGSVTYTSVNGGSNTKIYNENLAGGTSSELLVGKTSGSFAIAGIPKGGAATLTVSYRVNKTTCGVSVSGTGYSGSKASSTIGSNSFTVTCGSASTFTLTFTPSSTDNVRLDDISITVATTAVSYSDYVTECCTDWATPTLTYSVPSGWKSGSANVDATIGSGDTYGAVSFESSNTGVLTVNSSGQIHAVGAGTSTVTATWTGDGTHCEKSTTSATITVTGKVRVTFNKNGGTGTDKYQDIDYNTATALNTISTIGYTAPSCKQFGGWATSQANADAGTVAYADGASITPTEGITLYAIWNTITYNVTKGTNTGAATFTLSSTSIACGATLTITCAADGDHKGNPTVTATGTHGEITVVSATSVTIANVQSDMTVNISYPAKDIYTITWMANGSTYTAGGPTTSVTEGNAIATLPTTPTSCDTETYTNFVGWYAFEAGSQSDPTSAATFAANAGDKVTTSTIPTGNVTYYAVFSDGDADGWTLINSTSDLIDGEEYTFGSGTAGPTSGYAMGTQNSNNRSAVAWDSEDLKTFTLGDLGEGRWSLYTTDGYLYAASSSSNYLKSKASNYGAAECDWTITFSGDAATVCSQGTYTRKYVKYNSQSGGLFSCYESGTVYIYKKGGVGTGYISTCGTNVKITNGDQHLTSANGIWVESNQNVVLTGTNMTDTYSAVTIEVTITAGGTSKWRVKDASTAGQGGTSGVTFTNIITSNWNKNIAVTYTPSAANVASEEATIQVKVYKYGDATKVACTKTFKMYGRSLPANFLIAVNDGTAADGHWYAIPADMIAPYGSTCSSGLGTYSPIPITVDNGTNPTKATMAPARAVYQPAARTGNVNTSPQTISFKCKTSPTGSGTYYLYGGGTGGDANNTNTHIQNASFASSEKQKWFLKTSDLVTYEVRLATTISPNVLGFTTAGGNNRVGQYGANTSTTKKDIRFLPFDVSECVYIPAPEVKGVSLDANYTIQFPKDRLATAWQISTDGGSNWVALPGKTEIACSGGVETPTTVQGVLPMSTYRGQTVKIKVSSPSATCGTNIGEFVVPNPVITVNGETPWHLYGITGQAFSDQTQTITLSGLYEGAGAETLVTSSNPEITASLVAPVVNGDVHVLLTMTAGAATEGNHNTTLTFTSTGAETKTRNVTITMQSLAPQSFTKSAYFTGDILCTNSDLSSNTTYAFSLTNPIYSAAGVLDATSTTINKSDLYIYDVATGEKVNGKSFQRTVSSAGIPSFSFSNFIADMVEGKKYRIEWTNKDLACKNSTGVPYQDVSYTFTYGDCSKPIALQACPITQTGFTANWIPSGSSSQSLSVYTYGAGSTICNHTWTEWIGAVGVLYHTDYTNTTNCPRGFYVAQQYGDVSKKGSYGSSSNYDSTKGQRMSGAAADALKVNGIYTILIPETGNYRVTYTATTLSNPNTLKVALTDNYGDISSTLFTDDITTTTTFTHLVTVGTAGTYKIALLPTHGSSSLGSVFIKYFKVEKVGSKSYVTGFGPKTGIASSINEYSVTGLSSGVTYYYSVSNGTESNEVSVTTRDAAPAIDFSPTKAVLQTDVNGTVSTTISLDGTNITLCELLGTIGGTNAAYFSADPSGLVYNQVTGAVSGNLVITYHPTTTGKHTATYTIDGVVLDLEGHACPSGFGTQATAATSVTSSSAQANWSQNTTGYFMLAENQRMNTELLINGGFEQDGLDWDGVPNLFTPSSGSTHNEIKTALKRSGTNGLYVTYSQGGSFLYIGEGSSLFSGAFGAKQTLPAGTYTISAYVHGVSGSSSLAAFASSDYHTMYVGFAVDYPTKSYSTSRKAVGTPTGVRINGQTGWVKVEDTFTLNEPTTGYIFVVNSTTLGTNFALDDVSLKCTGAVAGNAFSEYPITNVKKYSLTDLKPSTSYSYYVVNADGCESNIISFTTISSGAAAELTATPNPVEIEGPIGQTTSKTFNISAENTYSAILLSLASDCSDGRISLGSTSLGANGGLVVVNFTPLSTDEPGTTGTCTINATTLGMASSPYTITVNWRVGFMSEDAEIIEVVDISNSTMSVDHNIGISKENGEVRIQLQRELSDEEIEENTGDEIFFSKYYEAYMHKKILAIYNPTNDTISLKGTYIWRSKGSSAGDEAAWNRETAISLADKGKSPGKIAPQEEIIIYNSQLSYSCEQTKVDMSDWAGTSEQAIYFDGDDAFLLVRKVRTGESDYRTPPTQSVGWVDDNNHALGHPSLTWRSIVDDDETEWTMLDLIGARAKNNMPDGSAVQHWSWKNCTSGETETGDESGWVGYGFDVNDEGWLSNTCSGQTTPGYLLSTNRCLLIRRYDVKSGNNAVAVNVGDMYTLGKGGVAAEWKGAHVPTKPADEQDDISCENFSFLGGYDYAGYYNAWTNLTKDQDYSFTGTRQSDGSYLFTDMQIPRFWCNLIRIEVLEHVTVNGVEVDDIRKYKDYKVPIVVDEDAYTDNAKFFGTGDGVGKGPTYGSGTDLNLSKDEWRTACQTCDVVIRDNSKLTTRSGGQNEFHEVQVYSGSNLMVTPNLGFELNSLQMRSENDEVSYAILNDKTATIVVDTVSHVKRIDDSYWYPFSLPYNCKLATIHQLNGKTVGEYDVADNGSGDWVILEYRGDLRQEANTASSSGGNDGMWWRAVPYTGTLQAGKAYYIGLYTITSGIDNGISYKVPKSIVFPPMSGAFYSESGDAAKSTTVYSWSVGKDTSKPINQGWNFVGSPYISIFDPTNANVGSDMGVNKASVMLMGKYAGNGALEYIETDKVFVSVLDNVATKRYTQVNAATATLQPFKGYFVQVAPTASNQEHSLTFSKNGRELNKAPRRQNSLNSNASAWIELWLTDLDSETMNHDNTGILVSDDYTAEYEVGHDLVKMLSKADYPQIYTIASDNGKNRAYNALPVDYAQNIPLGIYAPKQGQFSISLKENLSELEYVTAVWLLYNGQPVKNLLFGDYMIDAQKKGMIEGYSIGIDMAHKVPTIIGEETDGTDNITISQQDGKLFVDGVADCATITLYDMVGKQISSAKASGGYAELAVPVAGSYNIVVRTDKSVKTIKTVVR